MKCHGPPFNALCSLLLAGGRIRSYFTGRIANDEEVVFFPTLASERNETHWDVPIHGWIFEPEHDSRKRNAFLRLLRKSLPGVQKENIYLTRRVRTFLVDNERWKSPRISVAKKEYRPPLSGKNGHFRGSVVISKEALTESEDVDDGVLSISTQAKDGRLFQGKIHLVPKDGLSIISDLDDTIKITNVTDKKLMLKNSFMEPFKEVPGMAQQYSSWKEDYGAKFHFVSSSPFQLYSELEDFRDKAGFPSATFHLKTIRPKDKTIIRLFTDPEKTKTATISAILNQFPSRTFVLVGDSGEKDPEAYGNIAREFPRQIIRIFIRTVTTENFEERGRQAFLDVPAAKWKFFESADELDSEDLTWGDE